MSGGLIASIEKPDLILITGRRGGTLAGGKSTVADTLAYEVSSDSFNPNVMPGDRDDFPSAKTHPSPFVQTPEQIRMEKLKTDDFYIGLIDSKLRIITRPHQKAIILGDWLPRFENPKVVEKLNSLKARYNVFVIFVECDPKVQYDRLKQRAGNDLKAAERDLMYTNNEPKFMADFAARSQIDNAIFESFTKLDFLHKVIDSTQNFPLQKFNSLGKDITIYDLNDRAVQNFITGIVDFINFGHARSNASNSDASSGSLDFNTRFAMKSEVEARRNSRKLSGESKFSDSTGGVFAYNFTHSPLVRKPTLARCKSVSSFFLDNRELPPLSLPDPVGVPTVEGSDMSTVYTYKSAVRGNRPKSNSVGSEKELEHSSKKMKPFNPLFSNFTANSHDGYGSYKRVNQSSPAASAAAERFNPFQLETTTTSVNPETTPQFSSLSSVSSVKESPVNNAQSFSIFSQDVSPAKNPSQERSRPPSVPHSDLESAEIGVFEEQPLNEDNFPVANTSSPRNNPW